MNKKEEVRLSKILSFILRHKPEEFNVVLDKTGWTSVKDLISKINRKEKKLKVGFDDIKIVVDNNDKKRFLLSDDNKKIRANQGHSIDIDLGLKPTVPPSILYHGTAYKNIPSIKKTGLNKGSRHHVHLSTNTDTATNVGQRYGSPIVLKVDAEKMYNDGHKFYVSDNNVWLTDSVDPSYIKF